MKTLTRTDHADGSTTPPAHPWRAPEPPAHPSRATEPPAHPWRATEPPAHPWRATGHEAPVFADPSGRRALTMGGLGLTMAAATLAALVIVVTAAFGFTTVPALRFSHALGARSTLTATHRIVHHVDLHRFAALGNARSSRPVSDTDGNVNRHSHV